VDTLREGCSVRALEHLDPPSEPRTSSSTTTRSENSTHYSPAQAGPPPGGVRMVTSSPLRLKTLSGEHAVCRLSPGSVIPPPEAAPDGFYSLTITPDEISVVCSARSVPPDAGGRARLARPRRPGAARLRARWHSGRPDQLALGRRQSRCSPSRRTTPTTSSSGTYRRPSRRWLRPGIMSNPEERFPVFHRFELENWQSGAAASSGRAGQVVPRPLKRRSRRLLETTKTEEKAIAAPASIGLSSPAAASGRAARL